MSRVWVNIHPDWVTDFEHGYCSEGAYTVDLKQGNSQPILGMGMGIVMTVIEMA